MISKLSLRLAASTDSELIYRWRNREQVRLVSKNPKEIIWETHIEWFERNKYSATSQIFIVEFCENPVGVFRLENIDSESNSSSWGCYLGDSELPPGFGTLLPFVALDYGFYSVGLRRMTGEVLSINSNMLSIHKKMGLTQEGLLRQEVFRSPGIYLDAVLFGIFKEEWEILRNRFVSLLPTNLRTLIQNYISSQNGPQIEVDNKKDRLQ